MSHLKLLTLTSYLIPLASILFFPLRISAQTSTDWPMAGANPQRTSYTPERVPGQLGISWYRPVESFMDNKTHIIAANNLLYISTAKGVYALNPDTGDTVWRFDTELPIGHSPTFSNGVLYFAGYDKKLYALNATTGQLYWSFNNAKAGYNTNPLVINNTVYLGSRDGYFYAVNAAASPTQGGGSLLWQYPAANQAPLGPIMQSAAYDNNVIYFASNDMHAYALNASNGSLIWKSTRLPGERFQMFWPVIFNDLVIFPGSYGYKDGANPGALSAGASEFVNGIQRDDVFAGLVQGNLLGPTSNDGSLGWPTGTNVMDASRILQYLEEPSTQQAQNDPTGSARHTNKPWRRTTFYLNKSTGTEYTLDTDGDGLREYPPNLYFGTKSGNHYPPVVNPTTDAVYQSNNFQHGGWIPQGRILGWKPSAPRALSYGNFGISAVDEPQSISLGGNIFYRCKGVLPCDGGAVYWDYTNTLDSKIPGWSPMFAIVPGEFSYRGAYKGLTNSINGIYRNDSAEHSPFIPYKGKLYIHLFNTIIALGTTDSRTPRPNLTINPVTQNLAVPTETELKSILGVEVQKIVNAGLLKPGYYNDGIRGRADTVGPSFYTFYFENPGETLLTLSLAYPHLNNNPTLQASLRSYLQLIYSRYFQNTMFTNIGWNTGVNREYMQYPPEVAASMAGIGDRVNSPYPHYNIYALWKYALVFPEQASSVYQKARGVVNPTSNITTAIQDVTPWMTNDFIAGYYGFLRLQEMANATQTDAQLRTSVQNELNRLLALRANYFKKDHPWDYTQVNPYSRKFNIARNFVYLVPELGAELRTRILPLIENTVEEYSQVAPFWFSSSFEVTWQEGVIHHLRDIPSIFQAKAWILNEPRQQLYKYLDVPAFAQGDLYYLQNLIATIEAPSSPTTPTQPTPTPINYSLDNDTDIDIYDILILISRFTQNLLGDFNQNGRIDIFDFNTLLKNRL